MRHHWAGLLVKATTLEWGWCYLSLVSHGGSDNATTGMGVGSYLTPHLPHCHQTGLGQCSRAQLSPQIASSTWYQSQAPGHPSFLLTWLRLAYEEQGVSGDIPVCLPATHSQGPEEAHGLPLGTAPSEGGQGSATLPTVTPESLSNVTRRPDNGDQIMWQSECTAAARGRQDGSKCYLISLRSWLRGKARDVSDTPECLSLPNLHVALPHLQILPF